MANKHSEGDEQSAAMVGRRQFLTGAATGAAALAAPGAAPAQTSRSGSVAAPTRRQLDRDAGRVSPPRLDGRAVQRPGSASRSNTSPRTRARASRPCRNRSSITAIRPTRCRSSSRRCTRNRQSTWPTATARPKAGRWPRCCTAPSVFSTHRWRSIRLTMPVRRCCSSPAVTTVSSRRIRPTTWPPWCAATPNGTRSRRR